MDTLNSERLNEFRDQLEQIKIDASGSAQNRLALRVLLTDIVFAYSSNEQRIFATYHQRFLFLCERCSVRNQLRRSLMLVAGLAQSRNRNESSVLRNHIQAVQSLIDLLTSNTTNLTKLAEEEFVFATNPEPRVSKTTSTTRSLKGIVNRMDEERVTGDKRRLRTLEILGAGGTINQLVFWDKAVDATRVFNVGSTVFVDGLRQDPIEVETFGTTKNSLIVLEPDFLIDVTELAECFSAKYWGVLPYFLKRFDQKMLSAKTFVGTVVNALFDDVLLGTFVSTEKTLARTQENKPLSALLAFREFDRNSERLVGEVELASVALTKFNNDVLGDASLVEPTFYSTIYGLQGRLDALFYRKQHPEFKSIVELKSGSAPSPSISALIDGKEIPVGMWSNHLMQITAYNLLLDSVDRGRSGDSLVLYSRETDSFLRNAPNSIELKQAFVQLRNLIVFKELRVLSKQFTSLINELLQDENGLPSFVRENQVSFSSAWNRASKLVQLYIQAQWYFLKREQWTQKLGDGENSNSQSQLWLSSIEEKEQRQTILSWLHLDLDKSQPPLGYYVFEKSTRSPHGSSLREGDSIIIHRQSDDDDLSATADVIVKANIRSIADTRIEVSIRNKSTVFANLDCFYHIETDVSDSLLGRTLNSVFGLLWCPDNATSSYLGLIPPKSSETLELQSPFTQTLDPTVRTIVQRAVSSEPYFIIQGPPGTGKTSIVLRAIVEELRCVSTNIILLLASTNRACDEICSTLANAQLRGDFLRIGGKDNTTFFANTPSALLREHSIHDFDTICRDRKIIVSTVAAVHANPELFALWDFTHVVVDEAAQIVECQLIGIVARIPHSILIGDHLQLPPVIQQNPVGTSVANPLFEHIDLTDLRESLFSRLISLAQKNDWNSYAQLSIQGRMHIEIQDLANVFAYNNVLSPMFSWQSEKEPDQKRERVQFIDTLTQAVRNPFRSSKSNLAEVSLVLSTIDEIESSPEYQNGKRTIGVIVPFRAQASLIKSMMTAEQRDRITVDTVERFQGSERDAIIISFVVQSEVQLRAITSTFFSKGKFVDRKLNVAITRAKHSLTMIGSSEVLSSDPSYREMIEFLRHKNLIRVAT